MPIPPEIFKAYDIRGIVGRTLTAPIVRQVGQALGTLARARGRDTIAIGRDGRLSGPELAAALAEGIQSTGTNVVDLGMVATPMTYYASHALGTGCSTMVTGSHNPPDYNGLKMVIDGETLSGADIQALRERIERAEFSVGRGQLPAPRHRQGLPRSHRRRRQARPAAAHRRGRGQRRRRGVRPRAVPPPRLRGRADVLRRRRHLPEPSPGSFAAQEPRRPDRPRAPRRPRPRPRLRRRRRPARRGHGRGQRDLSGPPADALRGRRALARARRARSSTT